MELYETIEGMTSTDYRERFKAEYRQTKIRYEKLKDLQPDRGSSEDRHGTAGTPLPA